MNIEIKRKINSYFNQLVSEHINLHTGQKINEGGLGGHMSHLYEDLDLTFGDLKSIFRTLASHKNVIEISEKIDGQNIFFTFNPQFREVRFARNNSHLKTGGMNREDIVAKWASNTKVQEAFLAAYDVLQTSISKIPVQKLIPIFGNGNNWYSAEIVTSINPNVINYDGDHIVLHKVSITVNDNGDIERNDITNEYSALVNLIDYIQEEFAKKNWKIHGAKLLKLFGAKKQQLTQGFTMLKTLMDENGLNDRSTIGDFLAISVKNHLPELEHWPIEAVKALVDYDAGINIRRNKVMELLNVAGIPNDPKQIRELIGKSEPVIKDSLRKLEKVLNVLASQVLAGLHSLLINNPNAEVERIRKKVADAINSADTLNVDAHEKLKKYVEQLGGLENIKNAIEGIVFKWKGKTYKLTFPFNVVNQILGLYRY